MQLHWTELINLPMEPIIADTDKSHKSLTSNHFNQAYAKLKNTSHYLIEFCQRRCDQLVNDSQSIQVDFLCF